MKRGERGFTLVMVLVMLAMWGVVAAVVLPSFAFEAKRAREQDFVRVGHAYAHALASYRNASPGGQRQLPMDLGDLVVDRRYPATVRHIRRLYTDPVNNHQPWVPVRNAQGRIVAVRSASIAPMIGIARDAAQLPVPSVKRYSDWIFSVEGMR